MHPATATGDMPYVHLYDVSIRINSPVGFNRGHIPVITITRYDHSPVGQVGIDVRTAASIPDSGVIMTFLDELDFQLAPLCIDLPVERSQVVLSDRVVWVRLVGIDFQQHSPWFDEGGDAINVSVCLGILRVTWLRPRPI